MIRTLSSELQVKEGGPCRCLSEEGEKIIGSKNLIKWKKLGSQRRASDCREKEERHSRPRAEGRERRKKITSGAPAPRAGGGACLVGARSFTPDPS